MTQQSLWPMAPGASRKERPSAPQNAEMFARMRADQFLAHQLYRHGLTLGEAMPQCVTTDSARREFLRQAILSRGWQGRVVLSKPRGEPPETLAAAFERLYGEAL